MVPLLSRMAGSKVASFKELIRLHCGCKLVALWPWLLGSSFPVGCSQPPVAPPAAPNAPLQPPDAQSEALAPAPLPQTPEKVSVELALDAAFPEQLPASLELLDFKQSSSSQRRLWLAARFRPPPGTHIYWSNPGETGLQTKAEFSGPAGVSIGPTLYPGPVRFKSERGSVSYGYAGETALFSLVHIPAGMDVEGLSFEVHASWLSCSDICIKEHATARLDVGQHGATGWLPLPELAKRLPQPLPPGLEPSRLESAGQLRIVAPEDWQLLEYYPGVASPEFEDVTFRNEQNHVLRVQAPPGQALLPGVVSAQTPTGRAWFSVSEESD